MLISCMVTGQLICTFLFAYAKSRISHDAAHTILLVLPCKGAFDTFFQSDNIITHRTRQMNAPCIGCFGARYMKMFVYCFVDSRSKCDFVLSLRPKNNSIVPISVLILKRVAL